jgi:hypothetical protein
VEKIEEKHGVFPVGVGVAERLSQPDVRGFMGFYPSSKWGEGCFRRGFL